LAPKLLLLLFSVMTCALLAEAWLRLIPQPDSSVLRSNREKPRFNPYLSSPSLAYVLRSSWSCRHLGPDFDVAVTTNALGMRGPERAHAKPPGVFRVLVLGDSIAFGFGVADDETFPAQLEAALGSSGTGIQVLNAGVPGWSADQHYLRLATSGFALDPDLVLVLVIDNDSGDLMWHRLELGEDRLPRRIASTRRMIDHTGRMRYVNEAGLHLPEIEYPGKQWLSEHLQLYHHLRFRIMRLWIRRQLRIGTEARSIDPGPGPAGPIAGLPEAQIQRGLETSARFRMRYHRFLMQAIETAAGDRGIPVRALRFINSGPASEPGSDGAMLDADCDARPMHCLNMRRVLPAEAHASSFLPIDKHPNREGYARAAAATASWLRSDRELGLPE
jgi:lysophospholipase L1-like esterase